MSVVRHGRKCGIVQNGRRVRNCVQLVVPSTSIVIIPQKNVLRDKHFAYSSSSRDWQVL